MLEDSSFQPFLLVKTCPPQSHCDAVTGALPNCTSDCNCTQFYLFGRQKCMHCSLHKRGCYLRSFQFQRVLHMIFLLYLYDSMFTFVKANGFIGQQCHQSSLPNVPDTFESTSRIANITKVLVDRTKVSNKSIN